MRARLLHLARKRGEDFQLVLARYANERLLFRLATSPHAARFVLKGAALSTLWTGKPHRATRDLDLLGFGDPGESHLREVFSEVLSAAVPDDGVTFDLSSLAVGPIRQEQEYDGVRVELVARVASARVRLQIDIGFGDAITPEATMAEFPPLLDYPAPRLRAYPRETVVAEKLDAIVQLGLANSRMKGLLRLDGPGATLRVRWRSARARHPSNLRTAQDAASHRPACWSPDLIRGGFHEEGPVGRVSTTDTDRCWRRTAPVPTCARNARPGRVGGTPASTARSYSRKWGRTASGFIVQLRIKTSRRAHKSSAHREQSDFMRVAISRAQLQDVLMRSWAGNGASWITSSVGYALTRLRIDPPALASAGRSWPALLVAWAPAR